MDSDRCILPAVFVALQRAHKGVEAVADVHVGRDHAPVNACARRVWYGSNTCHEVWCVTTVSKGVSHGMICNENLDSTVSNTMHMCCRPSTTLLDNKAANPQMRSRLPT